MITEALSQLSTVFRRRFLFNALLPTLIAGTLLSAAVVSSISSLAKLDTWWSQQDVLARAVIILGYLAGVWFLAGAVASQWRGIVRLFEGYPLQRVLKSRTPGINWHKKRARVMWRGEETELQEENDRWPDAVEAYWRYPLLDEQSGEDNEAGILPSRLGNILLAERYPLDRYGSDAIYFWPRLFPLLPQQFQEDYEKFLQQYEFPLVVSFLTAIVSSVGGLFLFGSHADWWLFLIWFGGGNVAAYVFYVLSLSNAAELGEQQRAGFDLFRHLLLEQWPTPADVRDEKQAFSLIQEFIVSNMTPTWQRSQSAHRRRHRRPPEGQGDT